MSFGPKISENVSYSTGTTSSSLIFQVLLDESYPSNTVPIVRCETDIFHPNIDTCDGHDGPQDVSDPTGSNVCLNLFDDGTWSPSYGLESIVLGLLFLLNNPNFDSILSGQFEGDETLEGFKENVDRYMRGEEVVGTYFDAQFFSNVAGEHGEAVPAVISGASATKTGCDVDSMNEMCESGETEDAKHSLTKQRTLVLSQEDSVKHVSLVQQGSLVKHDSMVKQASLVRQTTLPAQGSLLKQDSMAKQASLVKHKTLPPHGSLVKHESLVKQGSVLKQESLVKLCSLVKEASIKKLQSLAPQAEEADAEFDNRAMKLVTIDDEVVLFNDFSCHDDNIAMDTS